MTDTVMKRMACKCFNTCAAPLCPLDDRSLECGIWYPDEEICTVKGLRQIDWVKKQRLIIKRSSDKTKYFTFQMIKELKRIGHAIVGCDPDDPGSEKKWLNRVSQRQRHTPSKTLFKGGVSPKSELFEPCEQGNSESIVPPYTPPKGI